MKCLKFTLLSPRRTHRCTCLCLQKRSLRNEQGFTWTWAANLNTVMDEQFHTERTLPLPSSTGDGRWLEGGMDSWADNMELRMRSGQGKTSNGYHRWAISTGHGALFHSYFLHLQVICPWNTCSCGRSLDPSLTICVIRSEATHLTPEPASSLIKESPKPPTQSLWVKCYLLLFKAQLKWHNFCGFQFSSIQQIFMQYAFFMQTL